MLFLSCPLLWLLFAPRAPCAWPLSRDAFPDPHHSAELPSLLGVAIMAHVWFDICVPPSPVRLWAPWGGDSASFIFAIPGTQPRICSAKLCPMNEPINTSMFQGLPPPHHTQFLSERFPFFTLYLNPISFLGPLKKFKKDYVMVITCVFPPWSWVPTGEGRCHILYFLCLSLAFNNNQYLSTDFSFINGKYLHENCSCVFAHTTVHTQVDLRSRVEHPEMDVYSGGNNLTEVSHALQFFSYFCSETC